MKLSRVSFLLYFRNFVFGVEDGLVSTVGLLSGVAIAGVARETIILTGLILILVEGFSMAVGSFLSESSEEDYRAQAQVAHGRAEASGAVMFVSYLVAGFIPLAPYLIFSGVTAIAASVVFSFVALFALGIFGGRISHTGALRGAFRMTIIGGFAVALGVGVGIFFK